MTKETIDEKYPLNGEPTGPPEEENLIPNEVAQAHRQIYLMETFDNIADPLGPIKIYTPNGMTWSYYNKAYHAMTARMHAKGKEELLKFIEENE